MLDSHSYSSLLSTTLRLVGCVKVDGDARLKIDGTVVCYRPWQVFLLCFFLPILYMYPFGLFYFMLRSRQKSSTLSSVRASLLTSMQGAFRSQFSWWEAVLMLRRLIFATVFAFSTTDELSTSVVQAVICLLVLLSSIVIRPFTDRRVQLSEDISLFALAIVAVAGVVISACRSVIAAPNPSLGADNHFLELLDSFQNLSMAMCALPVVSTIVLRISMMQAAASGVDAEWPSNGS